MLSATFLSTTVLPSWKTLERLRGQSPCWQRPVQSQPCLRTAAQRQSFQAIQQRSFHSYNFMWEVPKQSGSQWGNQPCKPRVWDISPSIMESSIRESLPSQSWLATVESVARTRFPATLSQICLSSSGRTTIRRNKHLEESRLPSLPQAESMATSSGRECAC